MTNPIESNEVPPVFKKRSSNLFLLRIGLLVVFIIFIVAKVRQHENASKLPITKFLLSGETGTKFAFSASDATGWAIGVTTQLDSQKQEVLTTTKYEVESCRLERLEGAGGLTLEILVGTNLVSTVELAKDKRVVELKKDGWNYKEY